jgi:7-cyano-7-deazaguanine synthase
MSTTSPNVATIGLLLSGGLDSSILLGHLLEQKRSVQPFYVRSGLFWEHAERSALQIFLRKIESPRLSPLITLDLPLGDLYGVHWSTDGHNAPDATSSEDSVYLPGRNALLAIKPMLWCAMNGIEELALAVLASNPFADAQDSFFQSFESAIEQASGRRVRIVRPFASMEKKDVMANGQSLPLESTFSCISPIKGRHCGRCNKCDERQRAFRDAKLVDPTQYAT